MPTSCAEAIVVRAVGASSSVRVRVTRSSGRSAPLDGAEVQLGVFDETNQLESRTTTTDATGVYRFAGLPTDQGVAFAVRLEYPEDVPYSSAFVTFEDGATELNLPVSVYETTNDPSGIRAERVHYIVEFDAGVAFVAELLVFSQDGERTYVGDGNHVLAIPLPAGAQDLEVNDGELGGAPDPLPLLAALQRHEPGPGAVAALSCRDHQRAGLGCRATGDQRRAGDQRETPEPERGLPQPLGAGRAGQPAGHTPDYGSALEHGRRRRDGRR